MAVKREHGRSIAAGAAILLLAACSNNPYRPGEAEEQTTFSIFTTPPTKLDPTSAYYSHEGRIIDQIYEPPFTYHYLKRPYQLISQTAVEIPTPVYFDKEGKRITSEDPPPESVARAEYTIRIKRGIQYQPHPCFARDPSGGFRYHDVSLADIRPYDYPSEFEHQGSRELQAQDYALQIRRLADPRLASPILSTIAAYMAGLGDLHQTYKTMLETERQRRRDAAGAGYNQEQDEKSNPIRLDYMTPACEGVQILGPYTYKIVLKRKYPQILFWMCMHFFGPIPEEAIAFYAQPAMAEKQFSLNRCPVGTGPYFLKVFKPNELIILERNPNYHDDHYPSEGAPGDRKAGLLADAGKRIPFIQRQVHRLEKEAIPSWNKFIQGYYDSSAIANEAFDQAIQLKTGEEADVSEMMAKRNIRLITDVDTAFWYTAFNMLDSVVGGTNEAHCKLRQAISIALDYNEYLDIFANGRGVLGQGPLPPGIYGYRDGAKGTNPFCDEWNPTRKRHERQPIERARELMKEAGYPGGIGPNSKPLTLEYDHSGQGESFFRSYFDWVSRRLDLIGIRIKDNGTDLSRYRQKKEEGNWQIASGGWLADYPDPENFMFLFYGPNGKVKSGGANAVNYENPEYDRLFLQMESMQNSPERQAIIDRMMRILQHDAPAVWQYHPVSYGLYHEWYRNAKPHQMSYNTIKFKRLDVPLRTQNQSNWNEPIWQPVALLLGLVILGTIPAIITIHRKEHGL